MSVTTDLRDFVKAEYSSHNLIVLTNPDNGSVSAIDDDFLDRKCAGAIRTFKARYNGEYDPTTYPLCQDVAAIIVMVKLYEVSDPEKSASMNKQLQHLNPYAEQRRVEPSSNSEYEPTSPSDNGATAPILPVWDDSLFDDYHGGFAAD